MKINTEQEMRASETNQIARFEKLSNAQEMHTSY